MNNNIKRGRPKLTRETVQSRLREYGWEIPEGVKYRGANEVHTVQCTECGYITEKILHNVVYRKECCPKDHSVVKGPKKDKEPSVDNRKVAATVKELLAPIVKQLEEQTDLIINTAINREGLIEKFNKLYSSTVSRKGYIRFNRQMTTDEWYNMSDLVALELIHRLDPEGTSKLVDNYRYHRGKNPQVKPEKVLLMIMGKKQLFASLEQIQLIKMLL